MIRSALANSAPAFPDGLPFARPLTPPLAVVSARLEASWKEGRLTNGGLVAELEAAAAAFFGVRHVIAVSSCTSGLMLVVQALGPRRSVVVPSFTFSASAHAVAWNGLDPVFVDCDARTAQIDPLDAAQRLPGPGAILATHVFGAPCPVEAVEELGRRAGVPVVFDAAHAFGATRQGRRIGGFGDAEVFSMSPTKLVVAGEGGLVATNRDDVAESVRLGRDYGNGGDYNTRFPGLNARLSELHAAVALESLAMLPQHLDSRRSLAARYRLGLAEVAGVEPQVVEDGDESTYKDFTVMIDEEVFGLCRNEVVAGLAAEGIDTRCYFSPPVHLQQAYSHLGSPRLPATEHLARRVVSLPLYPALDDDDVDLVVEVLHGLQTDVRRFPKNVATSA